MIDNKQAQHMTDVAGECNRLNEVAQLLGFAVTAITSVEDQSTQHFTLQGLGLGSRTTGGLADTAQRSGRGSESDCPF